MPPLERLPQTLTDLRNDWIIHTYSVLYINFSVMLRVCVA